MTDYLILFAVVLGVNLLPAFGPPTWSLIVLYGFNSDMPLPATVAVAALAAASGRLILAWGFRLLAHRVPQRIRRNLAAVRTAFEQRRSAAVIGLGVFALSPVPSAQLFEAAGLSNVRLMPFTLAFFVGRLISYSIYAAGARALKATTLGDVMRESLTSPVGILIQLAMIGALVGFVSIDWSKWIAKRRSVSAGEDGKCSR